MVKHKHYPIHLNLGRRGGAWLCITCGKQLAGRVTLRASERKVFSGVILEAVEAFAKKQKERRRRLLALSVGW